MWRLPCDFCVYSVLRHMFARCYCVLFAVKSEIRWLNLRGGVHVWLCACFLCVVFFLSCDCCLCDVCSLGTLLFAACVLCVFVDCCVKGVVVGGSVLCVVCLKCVFVCCVFGVFCGACCARGRQCYVDCEWLSVSWLTCVSRDA